MGWLGLDARRAQAAFEALEAAGGRLIDQAVVDEHAHSGDQVRVDALFQQHVLAERGLDGHLQLGELALAQRARALDETLDRPAVGERTTPERVRQVAQDFQPPLVGEQLRL